VADVTIRAENLAKVYRSGESELAIFRGLQLAVQKGESLALTGESGAGKSTLLHLLGALDSPSDGAVYYGSTDVTHLQDAELAVFRNQTIGFVWQSHHLLPEFTALENAAMPLIIRRSSPADARDKARKILEEVGLGARLEHQPGELSGGERQRCAFARALVTEPACVLADEPTGNLDTHTADEVFEVMLRLSVSHGTAFVIVTHDADLAARAERVLELQDGLLRPRAA